MPIGAHLPGDGRCVFLAWAPGARRVTLHLLAPIERRCPMAPVGFGYWRAELKEVVPGSRYRYRLDDGPKLPDPASAWQPEGVAGPSAVVDHGAFVWRDAGWPGLEPVKAIFYELHVGTFTPEGTFAAVIPRLAALRELGVTAVELMPVAAFPGARNWGYDGVFPFAVQESYGGPDGLKTLVDACHREGLAVVLDVVYNHLGPEGNVLGQFGPYFTDRYRTPWGGAVNLDGAASDAVRGYFIANALHWLRDYHIDALRLDAVHALCDLSARPFLAELARAVAACGRRRGRPAWLVAESDRNDAQLLKPPAVGGLGLDAAWNDDFHHALHALLTGESQGYYADFGQPAQLGKAIAEGFVYDGGRSRYRGRRHGSSSRDLGATQMVVFSQNHDQVGNRACGERLLKLAGFAAAKLAAFAVLCAPALPLLFMGEEYGEDAPFLYFVDFADPALREAVRRGRKEEFAAFGWTGEPPDPQDPATFAASRLHWEKREEGDHGRLLAFHRECLAWRRRLPALAVPDKERLQVTVLEATKTVILKRWRDASIILAVLHASGAVEEVILPPLAGSFRRLLDAGEERFGGGGPGLPERLAGGEGLSLPPYACALFEKESP